MVLCGELKEVLWAMVEHFIEVCRRGLKLNADKNNLMVLNERKDLSVGSIRWDSFKAFLGI